MGVPRRIASVTGVRSAMEARASRCSAGRSVGTVIVRSIPYVGKFLHPLWSLFCLTFGFAAAHRISKTRAFFAGLLGSALVFLLVFLAGMLFSLVLVALKKL